MGLLNKKESNIKTLKWIYKNSKRYLPLVFIESILAAIVSLCFVALALVSKSLLDIATNSTNGSFLKCSIIMFAIILVQIICRGSDSLLVSFTNSKLTIHLRNHLFNTVSRKKYSLVTKYHSGDILNRFTSDTDILVSGVVNIIPNVVSMVSKIVGGISSLIILDYRIALIILVLGVCVPAIGRVINRKYKLIHKECQKTEGKSRSFIQECIENIVVVKTFEGVAPLSKKLGQYMHENFCLKMKRSAISIATNLSLYTFFTAGYYAVMIWGAGQISSGAITYGTLMAFLQLVQQLRAPMQNVSGVVPQYYSALASAERLMEIETGEEDKPAVSRDKLLEIIDNFSGIDINNINFGYNDEFILKNCSFSIPKNKITALTGESGSGKSTVFKLLLGLYKQQSGEILVNGEKVLDTSLRGLFAYVPQGNLVLSGTIRDNLTLYNEKISDEEIIKATKAAEIYDLINTMPQGFDTILSERGAGLSEGQIQRISIARALLTDAPVLLLDEATSALDEETETKVLDNIKSLSEKTVLFVTHRHTSLKVCDRIVHVENKVFSLIKE